MRRWSSLFRRLMVDRRGATAVEYGLILAMVVLAMFGALRATATATTSMWNLVSTKVSEH